MLVLEQKNASFCVFQHVWFQATFFLKISWIFLVDATPVLKADALKYVAAFRNMVRNICIIVNII